MSRSSPRHRAQRVCQHCVLPLPSVRCAHLYPPFQFGCATGVYLTCLGAAIAALRNQRDIVKSLCGSRTGANKANQVGVTPFRTDVLQRLEDSSRPTVQFGLRQWPSFLIFLHKPCAGAARFDVILERIRGLQDCLRLAALTALTILPSVLSHCVSFRQFPVQSNSGIIPLILPFVRARVTTGFTVLPSSMTGRAGSWTFCQNLVGPESSDGIKNRHIQPHSDRFFLPCVDYSRLFLWTCEHRGLGSRNCHPNG